MKNALKVYHQALGYFFKDKWLILLGLVPVSIGIALYSVVGTWMYTDLLAMGESWVKGMVSDGALGNFLYAVLIALVTIGLYFLISWTFVLVVSILASPFNEVMSARVERLILDETPADVSESFGKMLKKIVFILANEFKKVFLIALFSLIAFIFSFFPIFFPISVFISALLLASQFLDYSWSRHDVKMGDCFKEVRSNVLGYGLSGVGFLFVITIPVINLFALPFAVVYYSALRTINQLDEHLD